MAGQDEQLERLILDQARDGVLVAEPDGRILDANRAACLLYGYSLSELRQLTMPQLWPADEPSAPPPDGAVVRVLQVKKGGASFYAELSANLAARQASAVTVYAVRDITALVAAEQEAAQQKAALQAAYDELAVLEREQHRQVEELLVRGKEIRRQNSLLKSLQETSLGLMQQNDINQLLEDILQRATRLLGSEHGYVYEFDAQKQVFRRTLAIGFYVRDLGREIPCDQGVVGLVYRTRKPAVVNDYATFRARFPAAAQYQEIKAVAQIPLFVEAQLVGTIGIGHLNTERKFTAAEVEVLEQFAISASVALERARLLASYRQELHEKQAAVQALRRAEVDSQAIINALPDQLFVLDRSGRFLDYRSHDKELYAPPSQFIGRTLAEVLPVEIAAQAMQCIARLHSEADLQCLQYELPMNGDVNCYEARFVACSQEKIMVVVRNVTEQVVLQRQLEYLSLHDALTGIYNRTFFEAELQRADSQRVGCVGLLLCDVDGLKIVNDSLGHDAGDRMLRCVAALLRKTCRSGDIVARIGGDEFAVLMPLQKAVMPQHYGERLQQLVAGHNEAHPELPISLSLGFAVKQAGADMRSVFKEADNRMYREKLHQQSSARSAIVRALMKALEVRDFITEGHVDRLKLLMKQFAVRLGLPDNEVNDVCLLAQFHDIGKVGIPDRILFKQGPLDEAEWSVMRQHSEIGYRIARSAPDLSPIADWVLKHHEWWNGQGYPLGLTGMEIPLPCRMLAIVDAFDAMTSDRPYRQALPAAAALAEIARCAGRQFDPVLAKEFVTMLGAKA